MSIRTIFFMLFCLNIYQNIKQENGVYSLDDQNFAEFISKNQEVLVIFTNKWCIFCKQFYSEIVKLGLRIQRSESQLKIVQIDTDENTQTVDTYRIQEYPTVLFFVGGEPFKYQGHRNEQDIYLWTERIMNSEDKELELNQLRILYDMKLAVLFVYPKEHTSALKKFKKLQLDNPNTPFFHSTNQDIKKKLKLNHKFNLIVFKDFNGGKQDYLENNDQFTLDEMQDFVDSYTKISVNYLDEEFVNKIFVQQNSAFVVFIDGMDEKGNPEMITYRDFTRKNLNKFNFGYAHWNKGMGKSLFKYLGLKQEEVPVGVILDYNYGKLRKFKLDNITTDSLKKHLNDYLQNKLRDYKLNKQIETQKHSIQELNSHDIQNNVFNSNRKSFILIIEENTKKNIIEMFIDASRKYNDYDYYIYDGVANENDNIQIKRIPDVLFVNENQRQYMNKEINKYTIEQFVRKVHEKSGEQQKFTEEL